ncbi:placenta-specific gene 8 protein-like [Ylistrum balloti]|uniref:placenta-specific gene 8 protein-like n=1 Tax=Ylistrum balloti TaxID=509963 RepID=UPI002905B50A|nr:placenta-specific gene 8 protein-like [Ylistrum balloti]XP_060079651.1 placenta-specific gene 8 protein-like [Ylistrum balloti]
MSVAMSASMSVQPMLQQPIPQRIGEVGGHREWSTGLFGCFSDCSSCIMTMLCLPGMECKNAARLGECCLLPHCCAGSNIAMRARLRTLGGIRGSILQDICAFCWCYSCTVCQMSREMDNMGL